MSEPAHVNVHEAKTHLSRLLERVVAGEEIIIDRAGRPTARLAPLERSRLPRRPGRWKGRGWIADDFDDLPDDLQRAFDGGDH